MKRSAVAFIPDQFKKLAPVEHVDLSGKTVVVVGANTGIGLEAAKHFARMNPSRLILACRSQQKGENAIAKLKEETWYNNAECWTLDLSRFSSVVAFVQRFERECDRLDILMANAAVAKFNYSTTDDGWEETVQVNNLSPSLLCILLLPRIIETSTKFPESKPRIVVVGSEMHYYPTFEEKLLNSPDPLTMLSSREYSTAEKMQDRYPHSKLLNMFFVLSLTEALRNTSIIVNCPNPGYCYSELRRNVTGIQGIIFRIMDWLMARTSEEGSRPLIWAATGCVKGKQEEVMKGAYINMTQVAEPTDFVLGKEGKERQDILWTNLVQILTAVAPRVKSILNALP